MSIVFGNLSDKIQGFLWFCEVSCNWQNIHRLSLESHRTAKAARVRPNNHEAVAEMSKL